MTRRQQPISVTILGWVYIAVGTMGFIYHLTDFQARNGFQYDNVWIEVIRLVAVVSGAFMLRGQNWARWLALAWIAAHVILSAFHTLPEFAMHLFFCIVIAWLLFHPDAARYFRGAAVEET
jgi:hypothetical protein